MAARVIADMIVVINGDGQQVLLRKGVELPDYVDKDKVKDLVQSGLVEQVRARRATSDKPDDKKPDDNKQDEKKPDGEGSTGSPE